MLAAPVSRAQLLQQVCSLSGPTNSHSATTRCTVPLGLPLICKILPARNATMAVVRIERATINGFVGDGWFKSFIHQVYHREPAGRMVQCSQEYLCHLKIN